jgi:hypothetical protein
MPVGSATVDARNPTSKLMLTIFAGVATREREIMLERQLSTVLPDRPPD